jgi:hypothetical protein
MGIKRIYRKVQSGYDLTPYEKYRSADDPYIAIRVAVNNIRNEACKVAQPICIMLLNCTKEYYQKVKQWL